MSCLLRSDTLTQHQSDPRRRSNLVPTPCRNDDTNRVDLAARTASVDLTGASNGGTQSRVGQFHRREWANGVCDLVQSIATSHSQQWASIPESERASQIRFMELYGGLCEHNDARFASLADYLDQTGHGRLWSLTPYSLPSGPSAPQSPIKDSGCFHCVKRSFIQVPK